MPGLPSASGMYFGTMNRLIPLVPGTAVGQPRQHKMADVGGEIVIAPADIDLLAGDRVGAVAVRLCLGPKRAHIRPGLRFGQVHRAGPFARNQLGQVDRLDRIAGMVIQRLDLALRHQRVQLQRQAGRGHHVIDGRRHRLRQAHAAVFGAGARCRPSHPRQSLGSLRQIRARCGRRRFPAPPGACRHCAATVQGRPRKVFPASVRMAAVTSSVASEKSSVAVTWSRPTTWSNKN